MSKQWYFFKGEEQVGPVNWQELFQKASEGEVGPDDLVWVQDLPEWKPAKDIQGLIQSVPEGEPAPPPPPEPEFGPPPSAPAPPFAGEAPAGGMGQEQGFNVNPFFKKISDTAKATASTISAKSAEIAQSGKSRLEINQLATRIKEKKTEIGEYVYQAFSQGQKPDEETLNSLNYEIKGYVDKIAELESQIAAEAQQAGAFGSSVPCPNCGNNMPQGAAFCNNCGQKYEPALCGNCGQHLAPGAKFCAGCGAPTGQ